MEKKKKKVSWWEWKKRIWRLRLELYILNKLGYEWII